MPNLSNSRNYDPPRFDGGLGELARHRDDQHGLRVIGGAHCELSEDSRPVRLYGMPGCSRYGHDNSWDGCERRYHTTRIATPKFAPDPSRARNSTLQRDWIMFAALHLFPGDR